MSPKLLPSALILAAALAAAPAMARPPITVTRFHTTGLAAPGDIFIQAAPGGGGVQDLEFQSYAAPIAAELTRLGYRVVGDPNAPLVAAVTINRGARPGPPRSSGFSIGLGGGFGGGGYHSGGFGGGGVSLPVGGSHPTTLIGTEVVVQLSDRTQPTPFWEGRASEEVRGGSKDASPDIQTARLAGALFQGFPGDSARSITVK